MPDPAHIIAGHKAALSNPHVSEEAKERARKYLKEHGSESHYTTGTTRGQKADADDAGELREEGFGTKNQFEDNESQAKNLGNVRGGYKAAMHNPKVSQKGRRHAKELLEEVDDESK
ncbi:hypothetical protein POMI540_2012 [Schizosaccharomyces pombe]|uniref:UPF0654 protein C869.09 n=1 Tax=Schizosaccharomyces pombe (strain 972 / ATCC 24843) TaxID=284812 RepID=YI09_SCHPO|nr:uncharacterized protein SPAC869.09 [Schizosaccharomyces pombe]Q9URZ2.1 RecName: Full=UPF0654 protein C869.09 [Schizosaccharomyces pombe 972h-]CAB60019.1 conserved fungal protein [Schizosaccharomyces pombe]|eukprot:NP_595010.1 uncharacterized protein SPAC869.09 [Schizosaccharomyces pombe]